MIEDDLRRLRSDLRIARVVERSVRWAFVALLVGCGYLAAVKLIGLSLPSALLWCFPALPIAVAVREAVRPTTLRECAIWVDRELRLEERVSTALEADGPLGGALVADARRHFDRKDARSLGRIRWPRETPFLAIAAIVALALWAIPAPDRARPAHPELQATGRDQRMRILEVAKTAERSESPEIREMARELKEIAALLEKGTPESSEEALRRLRALEERANRRLLASDSDSAVLREIAERAAGSGAALARILEKRGRPPDGRNPLPPTVVRKLEGTEGGSHGGDRPSRFLGKESESSRPAEVETRAILSRRLARKDWPPRCDAAVRKYFSD